MHKVLRTFTTGRGPRRVGEIVDGSQYRNLSFLLRKGYLAEDDGSEPAEVITREPEVEVTQIPDLTETQAAAEVTETDDPLELVAAMGESTVKGPAGRVVIIGWPKTGKTTLAAALGGGRSTDEVAHLDWSEASEAVSHWFDEPGPWIIEGVAVPRALRKWRDSHPDAAPPVDHVVYLRGPRENISDEQAAMGKGLDTVMEEIGDWLRQHVTVEIVHHEGARAAEPASIPQPAKPLNKMKKAELVHYAGEIGVSVSPDSMTNQEIIAKINEKL